ncbi:hypothetical protein [Conexibacter sp. CPCC 206217]|uniref:hypothetical protein n=1 Tax=Conexibacter sp. CPCC 206217 TaxID=3064574 RepID=UPI00271EF404|nr:hypothetical protein [Conexibacter sp. CPCC 206217]MDO8213035.1 hypothetical protein [Conexibacter sp. CPCC 206217]
MREADTPSGFEVHLRMPYSTDPTGLAQAALKKAVVALPAGVRVSPPSAAGLGGCAPEQIGLRVDGPASCPGNSKIGTVTVRTPLLDNPLSGSIYLAQPTASELIKLYLVAAGSGVRIKLAGVVDRDGAGNLTATFDNNPQLPFTDLALEFNDGPKAPLVLPETCGTHTTKTTFTAWSGKVATSEDSFTVSADGQGTPCGAPGFDPALVAGSVDARGAKDSSFMLQFSRGGRQQDLSDIDVSMPKGLLARIADADLCSDAAASAGACGPNSLIGRADVAAGAGPLPFRLGGKVYITGPYKDAPFGLSIAVPAVAGPFDLGLVVVRAAIYTDRNTAQLRIVSDPMPTILQGIPLQIREVMVTVDRPRFMFNPSNCTASSVNAAIRSALGTVANRSTLFQPVSCASLPFTPKMTLKVGARGKLTRGKRTPLDVTLTMPLGQANNRSVEVTLPKALNSRLDVVNRRSACTIEQFRAERCPMAVGTGTAVTPLLRDPLRGAAYFVYTPDRRLPDLVVRLKGQVAIDLVGKVTITRDLRLRTTFDAVPDAPITKFSLRLESGPRNGPIGVVRNLCLPATRRGLKADLAFVGQNNRQIKRSQAITVAGCGRASPRAQTRQRRTNRGRNASAKRRAGARR